MPALLVILTITLPWAGGLLVWGLGNRNPRAQHFTAIGFSLAAATAALVLPMVTTNKAVLTIPMGQRFGWFTFIPDGLGTYLAIIATIIGSLAVIFSKDYMKDDPELGRYYSLVLLFIGAMAGLVLTGSLLALFIFWEITAFCSYALISFHNDDPKAVSGGIKALIITQVGGIGLLVGALAIYAELGSYQITEMLAHSDAIAPNILVWIAFTFLVAAIAKSAQVPLHTWLPDAMEAPTPVSALIHAATMVNAGVYLLARFYPSFESVPGWGMAVVVVGLLSALIGGLQACFSNDIKRVLAYSTVSQLGFMVYAIGVGAVFASQFHLLNHSIFKALLFLGAGAVIHSTGTRDMQAMGGLRKKLPFVFWSFLFGALALGGVPLSNGFVSKELILEGGLIAGPAWAYWVMLLATLLTALYATRMVMMTFFGQESRPDIHTQKQPSMRISLGVLSLGVVTSWLMAGWFSRLLLDSLPFHSWAHSSTVEILDELIHAPSTWLTIVLIALGATFWIFGRNWSLKIRPTAPFARMIQAGLGFEEVNRGVIQITRSLSRATRSTQTGQLQWNLVGIIGSLLLALYLLTIGGVL